MDRAEAWRRLGPSGAGVLGTVDPDRGVHLVPVVYTRISPSKIVIAVDAKPKLTRRLRRLTNLRRDPRVTLLVDHYESDWSMLWWVRVDGRAAVRDEVAPHIEQQHRDRFPQLVDHVVGPWIEIEVDEVIGWSAT